MSVNWQLKNNIKKKKKSNLLNNPQLKGIVLLVKIVTPRKPNSARRPVIKVFLSKKKYILAHIPGVGHNVRRHSTVLIRGGGAKDLPGVNYTCIRGVYDVSGVLGRTKRRSIYGVQLSNDKKTRIRKKFKIK